MSTSAQMPFDDFDCMIAMAGDAPAFCALLEQEMLAAALHDGGGSAAFDAVARIGLSAPVLREVWRHVALTPGPINPMDLVADDGLGKDLGGFAARLMCSAGTPRDRIAQVSRVIPMLRARADGSRFAQSLNHLTEPKGRNRLTFGV